MAQASFFYYNPESGNDSRQHDLFTPQPSTILRSSPVQLQDASLQHLYMPSMARPLAQKAAFLNQEAHILSVDTEFSPFDDLSYPRTPSLSTSSSAVNSPPQSHYLPTPTNSFFEHLTGVKEGCEHEVKHEILASSFDFSRAGSPPLTPVFVNPPNVTAASASQASELLSISSCPSLSPSPSPAPQSIASQAEHFCDPRNLLVNSRPTALVNQLDIPTLPAFIPSNDDLLLGLHSVQAKPTEVSSSVLDPIPPEVESVPFFDTLDDLDSETDFITDLSQETGFYTGAKRHRLDSIHFSEEYLSEASFDDDWTSMSPLSQADSTDMSSRKSSKPAAKKQKLDDNTVDFDFASNYAGSADTNVATSVSGVSGQDNKESSIAPASEASTPSGQQANRRGRKQSLTDDPSKTFVCTLCARRFRRQEHLKRHYRSLHTQDKPFECSDCGKKFSRSDNLAQHARTHGNTTTIVGINMPEIDEKTATMSAHLFETAAAVSSSSSSNGSDDEKAAKKRKRDE